MKVWMTDGQMSAVEIYILDPIHFDDDNDDDNFMSAAAYRQVAGMVTGQTLVFSIPEYEVLNDVITEACNSADAENTKAGNMAARVLCNLSKKLNTIMEGVA